VGGFVFFKRGKKCQGGAVLERNEERRSKIEEVLVLPNQERLLESLENTFRPSSKSGGGVSPNKLKKEKGKGKEDRGANKKRASPYACDT